MRSNSRVGSDLLIDPKGNSSVIVVDGASRTLKTIQHMRWRGQGQNPPAHNLTLLPASAGTIVTSLIPDGNGRRTQHIDDRGNVTQFLWDTLDRETVMIFQDGSTRTNVYDLASDVITYTDENGSIFANTFDSLGRKVESGVSPASGVSPTTVLLSFRYDGRLEGRESISGSDPKVYGVLQWGYDATPNATGGYDESYYLGGQFWSDATIPASVLSPTGLGPLAPTYSGVPTAAQMRVIAPLVLALQTADDT